MKKVIAFFIWGVLLSSTLGILSYLTIPPHHYVMSAPSQAILGFLFSISGYYIAQKMDIN